MADGVGKNPRAKQIALVSGTALLGAIVLFALWYFVVRTPFAPAFTNLGSNDAVTITTELERLKTPYELRDDGRTILVPADKVNASRIRILGGDLPLKGAVGFELFNKSDLGLTEFAQKINYQRALQGELARTIMALDEVETARVHLSLPDSGIFERDRRAAKASVTIATKLEAGITPEVVRGVQQLVASAVPDLDASNVAVLDARGQLLTAVQQAPLASPEQQQRQALEASYAEKVRSALVASNLLMPVSISVVSFQSTNALPAPSPVLGTNERAAPLRVTLNLSTEPAPPVRDRILETARAAIGFDTALGDVVDIQIDPALGGAPKTVTAPRQATVLPAPQPASSNPIAWTGLAILLLVGAAITIALIMRRRSSLLSDADRSDFATRLQKLLDGEENDARAA